MVRIRKVEDQETHRGGGRMKVFSYMVATIMLFSAIYMFFTDNGDWQFAAFLCLLNLILAKGDAQ